MKKHSKKRGPVRAKKVSFDGIQFQSGLELYMYKALKEAKIVADMSQYLIPYLKL